MADHRQLIVWQRAHVLSVLVFRSTQCLDSNVGARHYQSQLRRAVSSIAANIAEGRAHQSRAQFARYLAIAVASTSESHSHALEIRALGLIDAKDAHTIILELEELRAMLLALRYRVCSELKGLQA